MQIVVTKYLKHDNSHFFFLNKYTLCWAFEELWLWKGSINDSDFHYSSLSFSIVYHVQWTIIFYKLGHADLWWFLISWLALTLWAKQSSWGGKWLLFFCLDSPQAWLWQSPGSCSLIVLVLNFINSSINDSFSHQTRDSLLFPRLLKCPISVWGDLDSFLESWFHSLDTVFYFYFWYSEIAKFLFDIILYRSRWGHLCIKKSEKIDSILTPKILP